MKINQCATYRHAKGGIYRVIGMAKIKDPTTREWVPGVLYVGEKFPSLEDTHIYVRTEVDFQQRFSEILDPDDSKGP